VGLRAACTDDAAVIHGGALGAPAHPFLKRWFRDKLGLPEALGQLPEALGLQQFAVLGAYSHAPPYAVVASTAARLR